MSSNLTGDNGTREDRIGRNHPLWLAALGVAALIVILVVIVAALVALYDGVGFFSGGGGVGY